MRDSNSHPHVVVIDDDPTTLELLRAVLRKEDLHAVTFASGLEALEHIRQNTTVGAVLIDISLPDIDGIELLREARVIRHSIPCFMITAMDDAKSAVMAMKAGANDYFTKPIDLHRLVNSLQVVLSNRMGATRLSKGRHIPQDHWKSPRMLAALEDAKKAAHSRCPVVITGPIGTGKGTIAGFIHELSHASGKPIQRLNLSTLSEHDVERELFGGTASQKGGQASAPRRLLENPKGATLYLENIDCLSLRAQASMVDFLTIPSEESVDNKTKLVCSTSENMEERMQSGAFRRDLWFLLSVHHIEVPTLAERMEDIPILCEDMLTMICVKRKLRRPTISKQAMEVLQDHTWPYNLMELQNTLEHAVAYSTDGLILPADLTPSLQKSKKAELVGGLGLMGGASMEEVTKASLVATLEACKGNRRRAAQRLQVSLRTIYYMIKRYDLGHAQHPNNKGAA
jgi:DNA-binding NtrC family response regulator